MSLYQELQKAKTEEDVKDVYIGALGLTGYSKNLIDIQTKEVWFEAKLSGKKTIYEMFTQLIHYVHVAVNKGEHIPPFLVVMDTKKAAIMRTTDALALLKKRTIKWGKSASSYTQDALDAVSTYIGTHLVSFKIETHAEEFISTVTTAIKSGEIVRTNITPDNLKQVFDKWVAMIGCEIEGISNDQYALLFYADIMHDGTVATHQNLSAQLLHKDGAPVFLLGGRAYELGSKDGYRQFWSIYQKPPKKEFRNYLLERRDSLIPLDERHFKGAFYTPLAVVDEAYNLLSQTLGKNWQKNYIVWDMCCGVGNLEVKHSNPRNIYMSTLDAADVNVMKATRTCVAAERFQYDYLNDDISSSGEVDYNITNKVPISLRRAISEKKKLLVLINPPYAEATNFDNIAKGAKAKNKAGVAKTAVGSKLMAPYGKASNELFVQFLARIAKEIPNATIAMFSTMKYVNAPNFEEFRNSWKATFLDGFVVHNQVFEGLTGKFPIGFIIWKTEHDRKTASKIDEVTVTVFDRDVRPVGEKTFYNLPRTSYLNVWLKRPRANSVPVLPLKNAVSAANTVPRVKTWSDNAIAYMYCGVNDLQHAEQQTVIYSSVYHGGNGFYITPENLWQAAVIFAVRRLLKPTWLNDRDQFLQPTKEVPEEFRSDCLVWMLFNRCNRTAGADGIMWGGQKWSLVNHFIPFNESEVDATDRFQSDFMHRYISDLNLSSDADDVLDEGRALWRAYNSKIDTRSVRDSYYLNRPDVGWFQVRKALEHRNSASVTDEASFKSFETAYERLSSKLLPQVYDLGFMR